MRPFIEEIGRSTRSSVSRKRVGVGLSLSYFAGPLTEFELKIGQN
jgi:hypothetical protein